MASTEDSGYRLDRLFGMDNANRLIAGFITYWAEKGVVVSQHLQKNLFEMEYSNPVGLKTFLAKQNQDLLESYERARAVYERIERDSENNGGEKKVPRTLAHLTLDDLEGISLKLHYNECPECASYNSLFKHHETSETVCNQCGYVDRTWVFD